MYYSQLDDSEASVTTSSSGEEEENNTSTIDTFDIVVHRVVDHSEIPQHTKFGCELTIPGTEYKEVKESPYRHRGGREYYNLILIQEVKCIPIIYLSSYR